MRDYALVLPQFWNGETGRRLRHDRNAQVLALYLMTCPSANMTGLFYLPVPMMAHETGLSFEGASKALASLSEAGFAHYDDRNEVVWVPEMARCQIADRLSPRDNRLKGILRLVNLHRSSCYYDSFFERYGTVFHLQNTSLSEGSSKPLRSQDQDQDQDQDQKQTENVTPASLSRVPKELELELDEVPAPESTAPDVDDGEPAIEGQLFPRSVERDSNGSGNAPTALPFKPDDALRTLADASNGRFVATKLRRGQAIAVQRIIRAHPDLANWRLVGKWLAAGGEAWRAEIDTRSLGSFDAWLAHAARWHQSGRPAIAARPARAGPKAVGYAPATTAYERSEDLTDDL